MKKEEEHAIASKLEGISWKENSITGGFLEINEEVYIEFEFKGYPRFKIFPKAIRKELPPVIDLLPELALWEKEDSPTWSSTLEKLRDKVKNLLSGEQVSSGGTPVLSEKMVVGLQGLAKEAHPNEILLLLRKDHEGVLSEAIMPQGAKGGKTLAYFIPSRLPFDRSLQGSYHSHPGGSGKFSRQDQKVFKRYPVNIIGYPPFKRENIKVYDHLGNEIKYELK